MSARVSLAVVAAITLAGCPARTSSGGVVASSSGGEEAIQFEDEAAAADAPPASPELIEAESTIAEGRPLEARTMLERIVADHPEDLRAWLDLGLTREMLDDAEGAEEAYRSALRADATFAEALNNLGALQRDTDRLEDGIASLREAIRIRPGFASAHLNLGLALED